MFTVLVRRQRVPNAVMPACGGMASSDPFSESVTGSDPCNKYPKHGKDSETEGVAFSVGVVFSVGFAFLIVRLVMSVVGRNLPTIRRLLCRHAQPAGGGRKPRAKTTQASDGRFARGRSALCRLGHIEAWFTPKRQSDRTAGAQWTARSHGVH